MQSLKEFPWPSTSPQTPSPDWLGDCFQNGEHRTRVLEYSSNESHWSEELTTLHEAVGGNDHPIDLASRRFAISTMKQHTPPNGIVLDVGCSSGYLLEDLLKEMPDAGLIGSDYLTGPLIHLSHRIPSLPLLQFDLRNCPLPANCVDGITCLNVLEHIDEDLAALSEIYRVLKPGGIAHVEVPAGPHLYDSYDEFLMHHRRYELASLKQMAGGVGFSILRSTHIGFVPYPAFWLSKKMNRAKKISGEEQKEIVTKRILTTRASRMFQVLMQMESHLGRSVSYPFGIRCVLILKKEGSRAG